MTNITEIVLKPFLGSYRAKGKANEYFVSQSVFMCIVQSIKFLIAHVMGGKLVLSFIFVNISAYSNDDKN